jgi:hypothetical protein
LKTTRNSPDRESRARAAGIAAILCAGAAVFNYLTGTPALGLPPLNFLLFLFLTLVFAALWWSLRRHM